MTGDFKQRMQLSESELEKLAKSMGIDRWEDMLRDDFPEYGERPVTEEENRKLLDVIERYIEVAAKRTKAELDMLHLASQLVQAHFKGVSAEYDPYVTFSFIERFERIIDDWDKSKITAGWWECAAWREMLRKTDEARELGMTHEAVVRAREMLNKEK